MTFWWVQCINTSHSSKTLAIMTKKLNCCKTSHHNIVYVGTYKTTNIFAKMW
jgi:hypothetical protein